MKNVTSTELARFIGVAQPFLSQVRHGVRRFSSKKALEISRLTGIPVERLLFAEGHEIYRSLAVAYSYQRAQQQEAQP